MPPKKKTLRKREHAPPPGLQCRNLTLWNCIRIQGQLNGMGGAPELTLSQESGGSQLSSILSETETAISVSWSGNETKPGMCMGSLYHGWNLDSQVC